MVANSSNVGPASPQRSWLKCLGVSLMVLFAGAACIGGVLAYIGISESLQAESNLHATVFTISLVEKFVDRNGRWPRSWDELAHDQNQSQSPVEINPYYWPSTSGELQRRVTIDFDADLKTIASQPPMAFAAIKPIGPYYEYRDYGAVPKLQAAIRAALKK